MIGGILQHARFCWDGQIDEDKMSSRLKICRKDEKFILRFSQKT